MSYHHHHRPHRALLPLPSSSERIKHSFEEEIMLRSKRVIKKLEPDRSVQTTKSNQNGSFTPPLIKPAPRKQTRTKIKKPKYLSLKHKLNKMQQQEQEQEQKKQDQEQEQKQKLKKKHEQQNQEEEVKKEDESQEQKQEQEQEQELNLFPLYPDNNLEDSRAEKDTCCTKYDTVFADLFSSGSTIDDILDKTEEEEDRVPLSPFHHHHDLNDDGSSLVRTAMKRRESEEWVCYSEVSTTSYDGGGACEFDMDADRRAKDNSMMSLDLKLDYQKILHVWSDHKIYVAGGDHPPQTVPDLHSPPLGNMVIEGWGNAGTNNNDWRVPEMGVDCKDHDRDHIMKKELREASLQRYKEKRQSRLFSKRIRYQVRKLNAERRPRMKGRFVKTS